MLSLNFQGWKRTSGLKFTAPMARELISAVFYGDELMLANQQRPV